MTTSIRYDSLVKDDQSMKSYYVSWHTWWEAEVTTEWDFWYLSRGNSYKPRRPDVSDWDSDRIQQAFEHADAAELEKLDAECVADVKLMAFVQAPDESGAISQIREHFPDAVMDRVCEVDVHTQQQILGMIAHTLKSVSKG